MRCALLCCVLTLSSLLCAADYTYTGAAQDGAWETSRNWADSLGSPGVPGAGDTATILGYVVSINSSITVGKLVLGQNPNTLGAELNIVQGGSLTLKEGTVSGSTLNANGSLVQDGPLLVQEQSTLFVGPGALMQVLSGQELTFDGSSIVYVGDNATLEIAGTVKPAATRFACAFYVNGDVGNGTLRLLSGGVFQQTINGNAFAITCAVPIEALGGQLLSSGDQWGLAAQTAGGQFTWTVDNGADSTQPPGGTAILNSAVSLDAGVTLALDVTGLVGENLAISQDLLEIPVVDGSGPTLNLGGATLALTFIAYSQLTAPLVIGDRVVVVRNRSGVVQNTFANLAQDALLTLDAGIYGSYQLRMDYQDDQDKDGFPDVVLTVVGASLYYSWAGSAGNWSEGYNWRHPSGTYAPLASYPGSTGHVNDNVVFDNFGDLTLDTAIEIGEFFITGSGGTLTLNNTLTVSGDTAIGPSSGEARAVVQGSNGSLQVNGTLSLSGLDNPVSLGDGVLIDAQSTDSTVITGTVLANRGGATIFLNNATLFDAVFDSTQSAMLNVYCNGTTFIFGSTPVTVEGGSVIGYFPAAHCEVNGAVQLGGDIWVGNGISINPSGSLELSSYDQSPHVVYADVNSLGTITGAGDLIGAVTLSGGGVLQVEGISETGLSPAQITIKGSLSMGTGDQLGLHLFADASDQLILAAGTTVSWADAILLLAQEGSPGSASLRLVDNQGTGPLPVMNAYPEGSTLVVGDSTYVVSYVGGDGNDLVLAPLVLPSLSWGTVDSSLQEASGSAQLQLNLSQPAPANVDIVWQTVDGTALAGLDFQGVASGNAQILAGQSSVTLTVTLVDDSTHETDESFSVHLLSATGISGALPADQVITIVDDDAATPGNVAPVFSSTGQFSLEENTVAVGSVAATDANDDVLTYLLSGVDASLFALDSASGLLSLKAAANFEIPNDAGADHVYNLTVTASDGNLSTNLAITVTVTDVNEAPQMTSAAFFQVAENTTAVGTVVALDVDQDVVTYALSGTDAALFTLNATSGELAFAAAPDFELPNDAGADHVYNLTVTASDGNLSTNLAVTVTVTDVNEAPQITSAASFQVAENTTAVGTVVALDVDQDVVTYALSGTDAALFTLNATSGVLAFATAPDFELPGDVGADNTYEVVVTVSDGFLTASQALTITVSDMSEVVSTIRFALSSILLYEQSGTQTVDLTIDPVPAADVAVVFQVSQAEDLSLASLTIPAGASRAVLALTPLDDTLAEGTETLVVTVPNQDFQRAGDDGLTVVLRDNDADAQPLTVFALDGTSMLAGDTARLAVWGGTPPYQVTAGAAVSALLLPVEQSSRDINADQLLEMVQVLVVRARSAGEAAVTIADQQGAQQSVTMTIAAGTPAPSAPLAVPVSGAQTRYDGIALGTFEAVARLRAALAGRTRSEVRAAIWDGPTQGFLEWPQEPASGILPEHGVFVATRLNLGLDLQGTAAQLPFRISLYPGWNFIGLPPLDGGQSLLSKVALADLELLDEQEQLITGSQREALIGTAVLLWDGSAYQARTTVAAGEGVWVRNRSTAPQTLLTLRVPTGTVQAQSLNAAQPARLVRSLPAPPAPGGSVTAEAESPASGCGVGGIGVIILLSLCGLVRLRRREDRA